MSLALQQTELFEIVSHPEHQAFAYIADVRLQRDIWNIWQDLPPLRGNAHRQARKSISFEGIALDWLKELVKLTVLIAVGNRKWLLGYVVSIINATKKFSGWLVKQGYVTPSALSPQVVQQWVNANPSQKSPISGLFYTLKQLGFIQFKIETKSQRDNQVKLPKIIPEEVKYKIDIAFGQLDKPINLVFKLHETLGTRTSEIAKIPLDCLRCRKEVARIRLCTGKQDDIEQEQDIPEELILLVQEQQAFVRQQFGNEFPWLFPNWIVLQEGFPAKVWPPTFRYKQEQIKSIGRKMNLLLKRLIEENNIRTNDGRLAYVTTHMFRRTYATLADRMGKRPDLIQQGLRHTNPDMQDFYVQVSPQQQEKRINRVLVNKDAQIITIRTDQDSEFLRREWLARQVELGVCTRPLIMKDCEFEYVCLGCEHIRFAQEHLLRLLEIREENQKLLEHCLENGQSDSRRANSAHQLISILNPIIAKLQ
ncbi:site-specific integrase [Nostoc sp. FACHB-110]|uniref:site-specific integrase n=1 Tax=Nostoc sp. FACHB-110 TaxID=2692834 RepID=UPI0016826442|nr:site-specific integrase [Nostoc sp. FACHB-110]MBD2436591.1 site-specific integrase [Nostoc sp. FACHB-110]